MRIWSLLLMLSLTVFAGCADDTGDETTDADGDDAAHDHSDHDHGNATVDADATGNNTAPEASLEASALNGTAPLNVTFTIDGNDADGDTLTWELAQNDTIVANGTQMPGSANATLGDAGNYTFTLTVSDGQNTTAANVTVQVSEAAEQADPNAPQDMGWYVYDPATGLCHVKEYDDYGGTIYVSSLSGGTWVLAEDNGVDGLQISNNHPAPEQGFDPDTPGCVDGDLIVV